MERNNGCYYCHKKVPVKLKAMLYQAVFKPTMVYGAECWAMRKKEEHLVNKTRMLRWIHGISLKDNTVIPVMNGHPRDQAKVSVHCRWPLIRGNLTLKCVGRGIDNVAAHDGGRPRQVLL